MSSDITTKEQLPSAKDTTESATGFLVILFWGTRGLVLHITQSLLLARYPISTRLGMRKDKKSGAGPPGKLVAKQNLPSKMCVVCHRPFTWRKKWERVWEEVTTCSKSCNAKRKLLAKEQQQQGVATTVLEEATASVVSKSSGEGDDSNSVDRSFAADHHDPPTEVALTKQELRKQHKETVKANKQQRRAKRMGNAPELGRKPCDLCTRQVDLLIRCTTDESKQYNMVCGRCWPSVSGGVPDGSPDFPYYNYGGLWKNRNAPLRKKVGSGPKQNTVAGEQPVSSVQSLLEQIETSLQLEDEVYGSAS